MRLNIPSTPNVTTPGTRPSTTAITRPTRGKNVTICALLPRANEYAVWRPISYEPTAGVRSDAGGDDASGVTTFATLDARTSSAPAARATPSVNAAASTATTAERKGNFPTGPRVLLSERIKP